VAQLEGMCTLTCPSYLSYPSDVTDAEWAVLEPLVTLTARRGRRRLHPLRRIPNAIFCLVRSGQRWRVDK
jgi:putative transposase